MPETTLRERLAEVEARIAECQRAAGWSHPVTLVAVTKTHCPEAVRAAFSVGIRAVGENRIQEALPKQDACRDIPVAWHLIGSLQRNKARQAAGRFALIHSVDRADLALELDRRTAPGEIQNLLIQVNCSDEAQKGGVEPDGLPALLAAIRPLERLRVQGLMTMAAFTDDEREQHRTFGMLRTLRDAMTAEGHHLPDLSMGMSDDYPAAVAEGATMIRLGSVLFGTRAV